MEIAKDILYYISLICGYTVVACAMIIFTITIIGFTIDHLKVGKVMLECVEIYKERKLEEKIKKEDIKDSGDKNE